jgi:hypothetical protein
MRPMTTANTTWSTASQAEMQGLLSYLRGLEAKPQGKLGFSPTW